MSLSEGQFTAEEYQKLTDDGLINLFENKDFTIAHYLRRNHLKLASLEFLASYIEDKANIKI